MKKQEKKQRKKMEAFRSILKHFEQMFNPDITWTQVRPIIEKTEEFQALNEEEQRIEVFNKFKDRLKVSTSFSSLIRWRLAVGISSKA